MMATMVLLQLAKTLFLKVALLFSKLLLLKALELELELELDLSLG